MDVIINNTPEEITIIQESNTSIDVVASDNDTINIYDI